MVRRHLEFIKVEPAPSTRYKSCFILVAILPRQAFFPLFLSFFFCWKGKKEKKKKEPEPQWKNDQKGSGSGSRG
jgi:hypothetical protein